MATRIADTPWWHVAFVCVLITMASVISAE